MIVYYVPLHHISAAALFLEPYTRAIHRVFQQGFSVLKIYRKDIFGNQNQNSKIGKISLVELVKNSIKKKKKKKAEQFKIKRHL